MDEKSETFIVYMISLNLAPGIHSNKAVQITSLLTKKVKILDRYSDFVNIFSEEKTLVLLKWIEFNQDVIELEKGKRSLYGPIYSLNPVELETLKTYIETYLKTGFIQSSKSFTGAPILLDKKPDGSFRLCIDYWDLNNLIIKYRYLLSLIKESLDRLS